MFAAHAGYAPPESLCDAQRRAGTRFRRGVKDLKGLDFSAGRAARQKIARFPSDNGGRRFPHKGAALRGPARPDARRGDLAKRFKPDGHRRSESPGLYAMPPAGVRKIRQNTLRRRALALVNAALYYKESSRGTIFPSCRVISA